MKNRLIGFIIIGIALLIGFIVFAFNRALTSIVNNACSHGAGCPMWGTIKFQTYISLGIMVFIIFIGLYLILFAKEKNIKEEKIKIKIDKEKYKDILNQLIPEEKQVLEKILEGEGAVFQSDLVEKTGWNKVKVTRILDKLEGKGLIERKRRGMTNIVTLKPQ